MTQHIYRAGRKVGRTIYKQVGPEPSDTDELVGMLDTRELAAFAVEAMNRVVGTDRFEHLAHHRSDPDGGQTA